MEVPHVDKNALSQNMNLRLFIEALKAIPVAKRLKTIKFLGSPTTFTPKALTLRRLSFSGRTNLNDDIHNTFASYADEVKATIGLKSKDLRTYCKSANDFKSLKAKWIKGFQKLYGNGNEFKKAVIDTP
ncbi:hypothetical protein HDU76_010210 [Blyttiomyces sp. JEL0837]|nr:hypothetical protein HDU76_010210 [Blyttiomyces sp. JEL0837]